MYKLLLRVFFFSSQDDESTQSIMGEDTENSGSDCTSLLYSFGFLCLSTLSRDFISCPAPVPVRAYYIPILYQFAANIYCLILPMMKFDLFSLRWPPYILVLQVLGSIFDRLVKQETFQNREVAGMRRLFCLQHCTLNDTQFWEVWEEGKFKH